MKSFVQAVLTAVSVLAFSGAASKAGVITILDSYNSPDGSQVRGVAWDGTNVWSTTNSSGFSSRIFKHNNDATLSVNTNYGQVSRYTVGLQWVNGTLWSVDNFGDVLVKHGTNPGSAAATYGMNSRRDPEDIAWDGTNIYVTNEGMLQKFNTSGTFLGEPHNLGGGDRAITFMNGNLLQGLGGTLTLLDAVTFATLDTFTIGGGIIATGLAYDGTNLWIADPGNNQIHKAAIRTVDQQIPEPTTFAIFAIGLAGVGFARRRVTVR